VYSSEHEEFSLECGLVGINNLRFIVCVIAATAEDTSQDSLV